MDVAFDGEEDQVYATIAYHYSAYTVADVRDLPFNVVEYLHENLGRLIRSGSSGA